MSTTGKKPRHKTPEEFIEAFQEYIQHCEDKKKVPTIPGACIFMGYKTKQSFYDQNKRDKDESTEWADALEFCGMMTEDLLINDRSSMAIFVLKCRYEYLEKFKVDNTHAGPDGKPIVHKWQVEVIDSAQNQDPA